MTESSILDGGSPAQESGQDEEGGQRSARGFPQLERDHHRSCPASAVLLAVLTEGMRCYPPVATGFPRSVPEGGDQVSGYFVPGHTSVYMSQYPAYRSSRNFAEPSSVVPEMRLDDADEKFKNDKKSVMMPVSNGPRNCIGKNLAYAEMRVILARILFEFDIEMVDPDFDWLNQKLFLLWEKPALQVRLRPVSVK
ncbi:cytochrome P450 [Phyllosticta citrichinensis]|uniref:Cytochrome P450 n=1 Tax=Phyllosticta citrichinensis TaxID=1130410 RepID=A0ABR1XI08_9PEZI